MAKDRTHTGPALLAHDMGGNKIQSLGTSTESDGAARVDQLNYVSTSDADNTAGKAGRLANKAVGDGITVTSTIQTDPVHGEQVVFSATPSAPPAGEGSWLYTGSIQASNLLDPVKAFVKSLQGMGGLDPGQSELWDVLENGDYQHKAVGQVYGLAPDGTETFVVAEGQRVWLTVWLESGTTYRGGLCTVLTLGEGSTKAVLRPTADVLEVGSTFTVEGVGAEYEGWYWEVLSLPDKTLAYRPGYVNETSWNLFTSTQVSQAGSATRETSVTIPGGTSGGTMFVIQYFEMLDVLGVSTIPKGVVNWEVKAYVVADDPAATVFIRAHLTTDQGVLDRFGYADTPPIHNTSAVVLDCQGTISADRTVNPSSKLGAVFYGYSDSASAVTIKLVYNDASHSTRVQTPLSLAVQGTTYHPALTGRNEKNQHEAQAVSTDTDSFTGRLSSADDDVQKALDTLSKRESARYYLTGTPGAPLLSRFPGGDTWTSGALDITETATNVLTASSAGFDPGLVVAPAGHHILRLAYSASEAAQVHLVVKIGEETVAVSNWIDAPGIVSNVIDIVAWSVSANPESIANTDNVTVEVLAKTVSGTGTITILSGGSVSTTLVCPWLSDVFSRKVSDLHPNRPRVLDVTQATVNGVLSVPDECGTILRVSGTEALKTISTAGWDLLSRVTLVFTEGRNVENGTGNILTMMPEGADPTITVVAMDTMTFYLDTVDRVKKWIRSTAR